MQVLIALLTLAASVTPQSFASIDAAASALLPEKPQEEKRNDIIYEAGTDVPYPTLIKRVEPIYPEPAREKRIDDFVLLEALIGKDGFIKQVKVIQEPQSSYGFREATLNAVRHWQFKQTMIDGKPVRVRVSFSVEFNLAEYEKREKTSPSTPENKIYDIDEYNILGPRLINRVNPRFPRQAFKYQPSGAFVILEVIVDKEGFVQKADVVRIMSPEQSQKLKKELGTEKDLKAMVAASSSNFRDSFEFGREAVKAVKKWQFEPSLYNGRPVSVRILVDAEFRLRQ